MLGAWELVDIPLGLKGTPPFLNIKKNRRVVVASVRFVVQEPDEVCAIGSEVEVNALRDIRFWKLDLAQWRGSIEVVVLAERELCGCDIRSALWN